MKRGLKKLQSQHSTLHDLSVFGVIGSASHLESNCIPSSQRRSFDSTSERPLQKLSHYEILGVSPKASLTEIKTAFRERAKSAHPDTLGGGRGRKEASDFVEVLTAYRVLTNARERSLYDLSLDPKTGTLLRQAAQAAQEQDHARGRPADPKWIKEDSWAAWAVAAPSSARPGSKIDVIRDELRVELRSALRHAYLGPQLELEEGHLPECFEADERSDPTAEDVLQLVSGRTLLGSVRQRSDKLFGSGELEDLLEQARKLIQMSSSDVPSQTISVSIEDHRQGSEAGTANSDGKHRSRVILELIVGSKVTAIGVLEASKGLGRTISIFDSAGRVISTETNGILQKFNPHVNCGPRQTAARVTGSSLTKEECTHDVLRWRTSFVKHLQFLGSQGKEKVSVCRSRRAQLPPINVWIFPPRSLQHCSRSWYFEWPGHDSSSHQLWLPASVFVLTAAFESLRDEDAESAKAVPKTALQKAAIWAKSKIGF